MQKRNILLIIIFSMFFIENAQSDYVLDNCPKKIDNYFECAKHIESLKLKNNKNVYRTKDTLHIKGLNAKEFIVSNKENKNDESDLTSFYYINYLPEISTHILVIGHYEGSEFIALNNISGKEIQIAGYPIISPDKKYIAIANASLYYNPTIIQIWQVHNDHLLLDFSYEPEHWGPGDVIWKNNSTLTVKTNGYEGDKVYAPKGTPKQISIVKTNQKWSIAQ